MANTIAPPRALHEPSLIFSQSIRHPPLNASFELAGLTPRSSDISSSPSIVLRQSNLRKSDKDGGGKSHKRRCHSFPVQMWPLPMPVSRNRLRSENIAYCSPCGIPESPAESFRLAH